MSTKFRMMALMLALFIGIGLLVPAKATINANVWYVAVNGGNDGNSCLQPSLPCKTVGATIIKSSSGDTINIASGIYLEHTSINKSLTLIGANTSTTILDGSNSGKVVYIYADTVVSLKNLTFRNGNNGGVENAGTVTLDNTIITNNSTQWLGAGFNNTAGIATIRNTLIQNNTAGSDGGGIYSSAAMTLNIFNTAVVNNTAKYGAGISNDGSMTLTNVTVSGNRAIDTSTNQSRGGGIYMNSGGSATLINVTVANNEADLTGGIEFASNTVTAKNTIFANNSNANCLAVPMHSLGTNIDSGTSCQMSGLGDLSSTDPRISTLQMNGGSTPTHALLSTSPAIDGGNNSGCPSTDQRGVLRPQGARCDIGAYEFQGTISPTSTPTATQSPTQTPSPTSTPTPAAKPVVVLVHGWLGMEKNRQFHCKKADGTDNITHYLHEPLENNEDSDFLRMADWLIQDGFDVWLAHLETGPQKTATLSENAKCLQAQIRKASTSTNGAKVSVITHSMGGLVFRQLSETELYEDNVKTVFTLGTPYRGVPVDGRWICKYILRVKININCTEQYGLYEFADEKSAQNLSQLFPRTNPTIKYYATGGEVDVLEATPLGQLVGSYIGFANDGIVPLYSSIIRMGTERVLPTSEGHNKDLAKYETYFVPDNGDRDSYSYGDCILPVLRNQVNACETTSITDITSEPNQQAFVHIPLLSDLIQSNQTITRTVYVEGGNTLFATSWTTGTLNFSLISPTGQIIDPLYAQNNPNIVTYQQTGGNTEGTFATYTFTTTQQGLWQMKLVAGTIPGGSTEFISTGALESQLSLTSGFDQDWYQPNQTAIITANLSTAITSAEVIAIITAPDDTTQTITLNSQGDQHYHGLFITASMAGSYSVQIRAVGQYMNGHPFEREIINGFKVAPNSATFTNIYTAEPINNAGGSNYERLDIQVGVTTNVTGTFRLTGDLIVSNSQLISLASSTIDVTSTGSQTFTLSFDGNDIRNGGINGPYILNNLLLIDNRQEPLPIQARTNAFTTTAYNYMLFGPSRIYIPLLNK